MNPGAFVNHGSLEPVPAYPDDMPLIEILEKASAEERRAWVMTCPLALLLRVQRQASEIFASHGEQWAVDYIAVHVADLHKTRAEVIFKSPPCQHYSKAKGGAA